MNALVDIWRAVAFSQELFILTDEDDFPLVETPEDQGENSEDPDTTNVVRVFTTVEEAREFCNAVEVYHENMAVTSITFEDLWGLHNALYDAVVKTAESFEARDKPPFNCPELPPFTRLVLCRVEENEWPREIDTMFWLVRDELH